MKLLIRKRPKTGLPPGSLVHTGILRDQKVHMEMFEYDKKSYVEKEIKNIREAFAQIKSKKTTWVNIDGVHNPKIVHELGEELGIHSLVLEDIMSVNQRPKLEDYEDYIYIVLRMLFFTEKKELISEQISIIIGKNYVISFQETQGDIFNAIRDRIRQNKGRIRKRKADYLAYALMDTIVDNYFIVADILGEDVESIEDELLEDSDNKTLHKIFEIKTQINVLRKALWPLRDVITKLDKYEPKLVEAGTKLFLRDLQDHVIQLTDTIETIRDRNSSLVDIHLSNTSNKMNEVMKVLTIIATIFIPLTFIVGVYGMNFKHMPELNWQYGYFFTWVIMIGVAVAMLLYFRKKKWL